MLISTPEYRGYGGGIMTFYRNLAPALVQQGWSVHVIEGSAFGAFDKAAPEVIDGVQVEGLEAARLSAWLPRFDHLTATPTLRRMLAASWASHEQAATHGPFDLIEATEFGLLHLPYLQQPDSKIIVQSHAGWGQIGLYERNDGSSLDQTLALALETAGMHFVNARHTNAEANARWWEAEAGDPFTIIRPCWEPPVITFADTTGQCVDEVVRVFGRIQNWKGPHIVAEAWRAGPELPTLNWHGRDVATDSRGGTTGGKLVTDFPDVWGTRIKPHRPVSPPEVANLQARALLNLVPSTWDVFNFTAVEAMASGRPVVCSDKAGASELIEDGRTGFIYSGASPADLTEAMRRALSLPRARLAKIGQDARAHVVHLLDPKRQVHAHVAAYGAAIATDRRNPDSIPAWFREIALPRKSVVSKNAHLEQQPLRNLAAHVVERTLRKMKFTP
jgi:glycosyltransferase involved in cell wall biosynthesis